MYIVKHVGSLYFFAGGGGMCLSVTFNADISHGSYIFSI
jgi:hypothetical protein